MARWYPQALGDRLRAVALGGWMGWIGCADRLLEHADRLAEQGRHLQAGESYLAVARTHPALLAAWDGAIHAFCHQEVRVGRCLEVLDLELSILGPVPRHRDVLSATLERRARHRLEQGLVDAALEDLDRAQRAGPERASVYSARARALAARGDLEGAREQLAEATRREPKLAEANQLIEELFSDPTRPYTADRTVDDDGPDDEFGGPGGRPAGSSSTSAGR